MVVFALQSGMIFTNLFSFSRSWRITVVSILYLTMVLAHRYGVQVANMILFDISASA